MSDGQKTIWLNARALAVGVLVAIVSVATYQWLDAILQERAGVAQGDGFMVSAVSQAKIAAIFSALTAVPIVLVCLPIWAVLGRFRMNGWHAAAVLGLVATLAAWVFFWDFDSPLVEAVRTGLPYGICGALAGIASWWTSPARRTFAAKVS